MVKRMGPEGGIDLRPPAERRAAERTEAAERTQQARESALRDQKIQELAIKDSTARVESYRTDVTKKMAKGLEQLPQYEVPVDETAERIRSTAERISEQQALAREAAEAEMAETQAAIQTPERVAKVKAERERVLAQRSAELEAKAALRSVQTPERIAKVQAERENMLNQRAAELEAERNLKNELGQERVALTRAEKVFSALRSAASRLFSRQETPTSGVAAAQAKRAELQQRAAEAQEVDIEDADTEEIERQVG